MNTTTCPNCAWENPNHYKNCEHCNCNLTNIRPSQAPQPMSKPNQNNSIILEPIFCSSCGNKVAKDAPFCPSCGQPLKSKEYGEYIGNASNGIPIKSRIAAGLLALFIGGFGIHKFYCGQIGLGVIYLLFFWTFIPAIIAFIEGIIYLTSPNDEVFTRRYCQ